MHINCILIFLSVIFGEWWKQEGKHLFQVNGIHKSHQQECDTKAGWATNISLQAVSNASQ